MAGSAENRRLAVLAAAVLLAPGCFTGHLLDAARRREHPVAIREAATDGGRLLLVWNARVTDDLGQDRGTETRGASIRLAELAATRPRPQAFAPSTRPWRAATPLVIRRKPEVVAPCTDEEPVPSAPARDEVVVSDLSDPITAWLAVRLGGQCFGPVPLANLSRTRFAPWVWLLLPPATMLDLAVAPPLLLFAPAVIAMGE